MRIIVWTSIDHSPKWPFWKMENSEMPGRSFWNAIVYCNSPRS